MRSPLDVLEEAKAGRDPHIEKDEPASMDDMLRQWQKDSPEGFEESFGSVSDCRPPPETDNFEAYKSDPEVYELAKSTYGEPEHPPDESIDEK